MRKTRVFLGVALVATLLNGCGDDKNSSDVMPLDGRNVIEPAVADEEVYIGRAADGYLRDAFVWLDIDDDKAFDEGEEPSAFTVAGGHFTINLRAMNDARRAANERIIEPRDYPLMLLAIPGRTVDEGSGQDNNTVDRGFFMSAPPGTNFISPLTTMVKTKMDLMTFFEQTETQKRNNAHNATRKILGKGVNLFENYVVAEDAELNLYASIASALVKSYTPDDVDQALRNEDFAAYSKEAMEVIARNTLNLMPGAITQIDGLIENGFDYAEIGLSMLDLTFIDINLADPYILVSETTNKNEALTEGEKYESGARMVSSRVSYQYTSMGLPVAMFVDGYRDFKPANIGWFLREKNAAASADTGISIELQQQWVADGRVKQRFSFLRDDDRISGITLDSVHSYDKYTRKNIEDEDLDYDKPKAQKETAKNGGVNFFEGIFEAESVYTYTQDQLTQVEYHHQEVNYRIAYSYNDDGSLAQIDTYEETESGESRAGYLVFAYDATKKVGNDEVAIAMTVDEFDGSDALERHYEFFDKTIDINGVETSVWSYIFITDNVADRNDKYTRWDYDYISVIDLLEGSQREGLSEDSSEDLAKARELLRDQKLRELEGRLASLSLKPATITGEKGRGAEYIINTYEYIRLSEYLFSELVDD